MKGKNRVQVESSKNHNLHYIIHSEEIGHTGITLGKYMLTKSEKDKKMIPPQFPSLGRRLAFLSDISLFTGIPRPPFNSQKRWLTFFLEAIADCISALTCSRVRAGVAGEKSASCSGIGPIIGPASDFSAAEESAIASVGTNTCSVWLYPDVARG